MVKIPNLQNIPLRTELGHQIHQVFVASGNQKLLSIDYSKIELRILAEKNTKVTRG